NIIDNGDLIYNVSSGQTVTSLISGTGNLTQAGSGTLLILQNNSYSGFTTVNTGTTLQVGNCGYTGSLGLSSVTINGILLNGVLGGQHIYGTLLAGSVTPCNCSVIGSGTPQAAGRSTPLQVDQPEIYPSNNLVRSEYVSMPPPYPGFGAQAPVDTAAGGATAGANPQGGSPAKSALASAVAAAAPDYGQPSLLQPFVYPISSQSVNPDQLRIIKFISPTEDVESIMVMIPEKAGNTLSFNLFDNGQQQGVLPGQGMVVTLSDTGSVPGWLRLVNNKTGQFMVTDMPRLTGPALKIMVTINGRTVPMQLVQL
ncbi:MAG: autotransporter-associated beta strand repeat-containing protein, partial [Enterobacteriaceae bacterium]